MSKYYYIVEVFGVSVGVEVDRVGFDYGGFCIFSRVVFILFCRWWWSFGWFLNFKDLCFRKCILVVRGVGLEGGVVILVFGIFFNIKLVLIFDIYLVLLKIVI